MILGIGTKTISSINSSPLLIAINSARIGGPPPILSENELSSEVNNNNNADMGSGWDGSSSVQEIRSPPQALDQPGGLTDTSLPKLPCPQTNHPSLCENDLYDDFNIDDVDLNLENYEEHFGATLNHSEELFENGGIDSVFKMKDIYAIDSNCRGAVAAEVSSIVLVNTVQPACSNGASADSVMSNKTDSILCFTRRQAHSSLSFSGLTGESSGGDYQDFGASSILLMGEHGVHVLRAPSNHLLEATL